MFGLSTFELIIVLIIGMVFTGIPLLVVAWAVWYFVIRKK